MDLSSDFVPSEPIPVVRLNPETHEWEFVHLHWGLIPAWVRSPSLGSRLAHARAETVATKRAFREVFRRRRCLVVVDSFHLSRQRKPYLIQMTGGQPFGVGAITGLIYLVTGGLLGLGVLYDFWTLNGQISEINQRRVITG